MKWFNPVYKSDVKRFVDEHFFPQFKDLVTRYQPSLIFADGEWEHPSETWRSPELLAWLFNASALCARTSWSTTAGARRTRGKHGGYYTTEDRRSPCGEGQRRPRKIGIPGKRTVGIGRSFGYNRNENVDDYRPAKDLIHLLVDMTAQGGNLLLDVGTFTADGRIPVIMQQRLIEMGDWLKVNSEAISWYARLAHHGRRATWSASTAKGKDVYAICLSWPGAGVDPGVAEDHRRDAGEPCLGRLAN